MKGSPVRIWLRAHDPDCRCALALHFTQRSAKTAVPFDAEAPLQAAPLEQALAIITSFPP